MAKFRVEKSKDFTVMSNHHLRNRNLTLKAKGLLSLMLSLPEDWDYTLKGLAALTDKDGIDSIRVGVLELERQGYITRHRLRDEKGQLGEIEYTIYEQPVPTSCAPKLDSPILASPTLGLPTLALPILENPTQLNIDIIKHENKPNTDMNQSLIQSNTDKGERGKEGITGLACYRDVLRKNISYEALCEDYGQARIDEIVETMLEPYCLRQDVMRIGQQEYATVAVKDRMGQLRKPHIEQVIAAYDANAGDIEFPRNYLLTLLYNAPRSSMHYYQNLARRE